MKKNIPFALVIFIVTLSVIFFESFWMTAADEQQVIIPAVPQVAVRVYFANRRFDKLGQCPQVYGVTREIVDSARLGSHTLRELLKGPTDAEQALGFETAISTSTAIKRVHIDSGVVTADFTRDILRGTEAGCIAHVIHNQISQSLIQLPPVVSVKVLVDGLAKNPIENSK